MNPALVSLVLRPLCGRDEWAKPVSFSVNVFIVFNCFITLRVIKVERDRGPRGLGSGNEKRKLGRPSRVALRYGGSNLGSFFHPGGGLCGREDPTLESEKMSASRQLEAVCELRTTL